MQLDSLITFKKKPLTQQIMDYSFKGTWTLWNQVCSINLGHILSNQTSALTVQIFPVVSPRAHCLFIIIIIIYLSLFIIKMFIFYISIMFQLLLCLQTIPISFVIMDIIKYMQNNNCSVIENRFTLLYRYICLTVQRSGATIVGIHSNFYTF